MAKKVAAKKKEEKKIAPLMEKMKEAVEEILKDAVKFDNGTNSAGTRVRTGLQELKKGLIQEMREAVMEVREMRKDSK